MSLSFHLGSGPKPSSILTLPFVELRECGRVPCVQTVRVASLCSHVDQGLEPKA